MASDRVTLSDTLAQARARLIASGSSPAEASIDVDLYARTILGWDRATLLASQRERVPPQLEPRFSEWIARRERREPTAYIVGSREFWGREFLVSPAVLVPRPETEFIVEEAVLLLQSIKTPRIADAGTGSGILAVTLALEVPSAVVVATDVSIDALRVARDNARRFHVEHRIVVVLTSYLEAIAGRFDLIVSNPPYVKDADKAALSRDVRHEPDVALFGGPDGLRDVTGMMATASDKLRPGGWFVTEFGYGQEEDVRAIGAQFGLRVHRIRNDLQGIPRTAVFQKPPPSIDPREFGNRSETNVPGWRFETGKFSV